MTRNRALDFGCGVGRLTLALAKEFDAVVGLDISDAMLAEAKRNAAVENVGNASFFPSDDALSAATGTYDFVGTYIVIQHIPIIRGIPIIANLLDRVAPGGIASIHFSIARNESMIGAAKYWIHRHAPILRQMSSIVRHRRRAEPLMQMNQYPLPEILAMFKDRGFGNILVETEIHGSILTANLISRRAAP